MGVAFGQDVAAVHDDEAVAEVGSLVHVVGGEEHGDSLCAQHAQFLPDEMASLRVEAGGGLIENKDLGLVDQGAGDDEAPLHATGEVADGGVGLFGELEEGEAFGDALTGDGAGHAVVARVDFQVLANGKVGVEAVLLGDDAQAGLDGARLTARVKPENAEFAAADG